MASFVFGIDLWPSPDLRTSTLVLMTRCGLGIRALAGCRWVDRDRRAGIGIDVISFGCTEVLRFTTAMAGIHFDFAWSAGRGSIEVVCGYISCISLSHDFAFCSSPLSSFFISDSSSLKANRRNRLIKSKQTCTHGWHPAGRTDFFVRSWP